MSELFEISPRGLRYAVAVLVVVFGVVCGAVIPGAAGGTVCTILVVIGLGFVIRMIVADVGWSGEDEGDEPPGSEER